MCADDQVDGVTKVKKTRKEKKEEIESKRQETNEIYISKLLVEPYFIRLQI